MENFKKIFVEEARDLIANLEEAMLTLENSPEDMEQIEEVFRVMHSLKGSSGMFGFHKIEELTHDLETIYDLIRDHKAVVTKGVLNVTLTMVDHFSALLQDINCEEEINKANHEAILDQIKTLLKEIDASSHITDEATKPTEEKNLITYRIKLEPKEDVFHTGANPMYLIEDLMALGKNKTFVYVDKVPSFEDLSPQKCYLYWDVLLVSEVGVDEIKDVFIFVEDECDIDVQTIYKGDLLQVEEVDPSAITSREELESSLTCLLKKAAKLEKQKNEEINNVVKTSKTTTAPSIRVASEKLNDLMNLVSELVTTQAGLSLLANKSQNPALEVMVENIEKLSRQLRDITFSMTLMPLNNIFFRFQRLVRDLSEQLGKEVEFVISGGETELDKTIIEALTDPLMHLLRNCMDHGIETPAEKKQANKIKPSKIILSAHYSGANVVVNIQDNGKGIDPYVIREKAIEKELITEDESLTKQEMINLIFLPGFSTAETVTDVSGRGVGMDVVQRNIKNLRGEIEIQSEKGVGTTIQIILPLTLSIIDGLLVKIEEEHFVVPLFAVNKCYEVPYKSVENNFNNLLNLDDEAIPFLNLREEFGVSNQSTPEMSEVILIYQEELKIAICVDQIVGQYQAVLKPLSKYYKDQEFLSGATILGDGSVALVLDTYKIIDKKVKQKLQMI